MVVRGLPLSVVACGLWSVVVLSGPFSVVLSVFRVCGPWSVVLICGPWSMVQGGPWNVVLFEILVPSRTTTANTRRYVIS